MDASQIIERLEPEMVPVFDISSPLDLSDLAGARAGSRQVAETAKRQPTSPGVVRHDHIVPGLEGDPDVRVREYRPVGSEPWELLPALLWIHGGGFIMGFLESEEPAIEHIVETVGCAVFSVDWRWAPENRYPASLHDCLAAALWLYANAKPLGVNARRIAIGGKSSGGGSAAGLALLLRDRGEFQPCLQLLVYPMLDDRNITVSSFAITDKRLWSRDANVIAWKAYLGDAYGCDDVPIYAAPSRARDLTRLPSTFLIVGDLDLFLDEDIEYAQRLLQAGVPTELHVYPGAVHGFDSKLPTSRIARQFARDRDNALLVTYARGHQPRRPDL